MSKRKSDQIVVDNILEGLISKSKSKAATEKLTRINAVCKRIVDNGASPSISNVVKHLNQEGVKISKRSVYNNREGGNPYRELIDAWAARATSQFTHKATMKPVPSEVEIDSDILDHSDLAKITEPVLRYRITLLLGEVKGLRNQLNIARSIENLPMLQPNAETTLLENNAVNSILLNHYEIEILGVLLSGTHSLNFNQEGALVSTSSIKRGALLSNPGLEDALKKIIKSYTHPAAIIGG